MENDEGKVVKGRGQYRGESPGEALGPLGTAVIVGGAASIPTHYHLQNKLLPFDTAVADKTVKEIERLRLTGGLASVGGGGMMDGASIAGGVIKEKVYLNMLRENKLARFLHNIGGRHTVSMAVGIAAGLVGLLAGMAIFRKRKKSEHTEYVERLEEDRAVGKYTGFRDRLELERLQNRLEQDKKDWQTKIETEQAAAPTRSA